MPIIEQVNKIIYFIKNENSSLDADGVPIQATVVKRMAIQLNQSENHVQKLCHALAKHKLIHQVELVLDDDLLYLGDLNGYICSDKDLQQRFRIKIDLALEDVYSRKLSIDKPADIILNELLPNLSNFKDTLLGRLLMIKNGLKKIELIEKSLPYISIRLNSMYKELATILDFDIEQKEIDANHLKADQRSTRRALDDPNYLEFEETKGGIQNNWVEASAKFGISFLMRIHFRKCEFDTLILLVKNRKINTVQDLKFLLSLIKTVEAKTPFPTDLITKRPRITELKNEIFIALRTTS